MTWLRKQRTWEDLINFWMGHQPKNMTERYSKLKDSLQDRLDEAKRVGYGFELPAEEAEVVPNVPKIQEGEMEEVLV